MKAFASILLIPDARAVHIRCSVVNDAEAVHTTHGMREVFTWRRVAGILVLPVVPSLLALWKLGAPTTDDVGNSRSFCVCAGSALEKILNLPRF